MKSLIAIIFFSLALLSCLETPIKNWEITDQTMSGKLESIEDVAFFDAATKVLYYMTINIRI